MSAIGCQKGLRFIVANIGETSSSESHLLWSLRRLWVLRPVSAEPSRMFGYSLRALWSGRDRVDLT